jgi:hypothetical protein
VRKRFPILAIIAVSSILRIWNLRNIPQGLSLQEVHLGAFLSSSFLIRLPFAIIGIASIYLFYLLVKKISDDEKVALISTFLLGVLPWHVTESRIFSWGIILFLIGEILAFFLSKLYKYNLYLGILLILICIIVPSNSLANRVNDERLIVTNNSSKTLSRIFINKVTENYRLREEILFTNLDFGNYFFVGHPRERGGVEETQKLLLFTLPFIVLGLLKIGDDKGKFLITWSVISLFILTFFNLQGSQSLILILPFIILTAVGIINAPRMLLILMLILGVFESLYFYNIYFSGYAESQFSPRRPIYIELSKKITEVKRDKESVLVNDRIDNPKDFLNFYLNKNISDYEFRTFDYHKESETGKLFVDVLPDDPISNEPLYTKDGGWPNNLNILDVLYDVGKRQRVVIYRAK